MDSMQMKIGGTIAALRKARNLTQEQLAQQLGVSAPAVSKWETDSSYPDITLLCPLARALGTTVDTLLQFQPTLSDEAVTEQINHVMDLAMKQDLPGAQSRLEELLRQYPGCAALQHMAAVAYQSFEIFFPNAEESLRIRWRSAKRELLEQLRSAGTPAYWQTATFQLAGLAIADGDLEAGADLLKELPEHTVDPTGVWASYYLKKEQPEEALKLIQKQLYRLVHQVLTDLCFMMDSRMSPGPDRLLPVCRAYRATAEAFGFPDMSGAPMMEAWLRLGRPEEAARCFARYVDIALAPAVLPDKDLFTPGMNWQDRENIQATTPAMRRLLLQAVQQEEIFRPLFDQPEFAAALEKLKASV